VLHGLEVYYGQWPDISKTTIDTGQIESNLSPSFAIVIPVHNASATLKDTLDCIIPQLQANDRLYAIENGSSDNSWELLQEYRRHPSVYPIQIPTSGPSEARNTGIKNAKEDYVMLCDADDLWAGHKMRAYRSMLSQYPHINVACDMAVSWKGKHFESLGLLGPGLRSKKLWRHATLFKALLVYTSFFPTSSMVFKRQSLPPDLFSAGLTHTQDFEAWCYWAKKNPTPHVGFINTPLTYYRFEAGLSQRREQRIANVYHIVRNYAARLPFFERYSLYFVALLRLLWQSLRYRNVTEGIRIIYSKPHSSIRS
jgi:glycosyltransferase involved in cell wall biosynthesis